MRTKIFKLSTRKHSYELHLKIEIGKEKIFTSWLHDPKKTNKFTNKRTLDISELTLAFNSIKPVCTSLELLNIENFMFEKSEGEQFSLF